MRDIQELFLSFSLAKQRIVYREAIKSNKFELLAVLKPVLNKQITC